MSNSINSSISPLFFQTQNASRIDQLSESAELHEPSLLTNSAPKVPFILEALPTELLLMMMRYLDRPTLNTMRLVSSTLNQIATPIPVPIKITKRSELQKTLIALNDSKRKISTLTLYGADFRNEDLQKLSASLSIHNLVLQECANIDDEGLEHVSRLTQLQRLNLESCDYITDAGLEHVSRLTQLQQLELSLLSNITDAGLEHISRLPRLQHLTLEFCCNLTDLSLEHVSRLTQLLQLCLWDCINITDVGLNYVSRLKQLQQLDLSGCINITDAGRAQLSELTSLHVIYGAEDN